MKLYVVNVGVNTADAGKRGLRSPVFPDGTFEFVPIKEESRFSQAEGIRSYNDLPSWAGRTRSLADFLPEQVRQYRAHADPEFETFTYGDILSVRAANLAGVVPGDQLWFLARLWDHDGIRWAGASGFYFIALIEVEQNRFFAAGTGPEGIRLDLRERIGNNAHYHRLLAGDTTAFRILCGKRAASWRFHRALKVTPEVVGVLFGGSYDESSGVFRKGSKILRNKNGRPRRFDRFGSITRTIQCFLDSEITDQEDGVRELNGMAAQCGGRAGRTGAEPRRSGGQPSRVGALSG